jgi:hypothetical protein
MCSTLDQTMTKASLLVPPAIVDFGRAGHNTHAMQPMLHDNISPQAHYTAREIPRQHITNWVQPNTRRLTSRQPHCARKSI